MLTRRRESGRPSGSPASSLTRCLLVETTATAAATVVLRLLSPDLASLRHAVPAGAPFDVLLAKVAAVSLAACVLWAWMATTAVVVEAVTGVRVQRGGCPRVVRRAVLLACGVALVAGTTPANATTDGPSAVAEARAPGGEDRSILAGLPMPDRPAGPARPTVAPTPVLAARPPHDPVAPRHGEVVVRPGDTLWDIAARDLPAEAPPAAVSRHWQRIWTANRATVGADPDLLRPGTALRLPPRKDA
ncbi:LysM peptidoglycan-binding domain-containing protein [Nocardioides guangzhouensis]|uniref:LysM peptidoglycan-binding domain-containing protein n=1 Tax=Nocardioides guangzhouensis TaxID=2497878 RepID=A0A4Q4ZLT2_9ACTN|nr:LysM peptidoglycan-binding domain-containing protein [Nocardioides guangzhouensis]RYP88414.1 LysM peptidoglycan-binding domain-containing protein [Nocardioides guangzhouensis]